MKKPLSFSKLTIEQIEDWKEQERLAGKGRDFLQATSRHANVLSLTRDEAVNVGQVIESRDLLAGPNILRWLNATRSQVGLSNNE